ncbi:MAG: response regulator [Candidatus Tectimicrobiota bacterium]
MNDTIRVVIVDDHPLFRDGVAATLDAQADIEIVGQGTTATEALHLAQELLPDVILLDINMPGGGLQAAREIATGCPVVKIVMLTVSETEDDILAALKAGARAYILKGVSARELVAILRSVNAGETYVPPTLAASLLLEMRRTTPAQAPTPASLLEELTDRERDILEHLATGSSNKEIAQQLRLSEKTVKHYMTNILQKLQVRNRVEAALLAHKAGYTPSP